MEFNSKAIAKSNHTVNIFARDKIEVKGVLEVLSSTDKELIAKLQESYIFILGSGLSISKLVPEESLLIASGNISGLRYENKLTKKSFFGRVFK